MFDGPPEKAYIVWGAYRLTGKSVKTNSVIQRRLEFLKAVRCRRYVLNELFVGLLTKAYIVWAAYLFLSKSLKIKSVVQRQLEFLKAVRFGRYVSDDFVCWASCEGLHSLGRISISSEIPENQICDPASAGFSEGHQIWKGSFRR